jgi:hypothetical protein
MEYTSPRGRNSFAISSPTACRRCCTTIFPFRTFLRQDDLELKNSFGTRLARVEISLHRLAHEALNPTKSSSSRWSPAKEFVSVFSDLISPSQNEVK